MEYAERPKFEQPVSGNFAPVYATRRSNKLQLAFLRVAVGDDLAVWTARDVDLDWNLNGYSGTSIRPWLSMTSYNIIMKG